MDTCKLFRVATQVNQWESTFDCTFWFNNISNKSNQVFIKYDIKDFCPSIAENLFGSFAVCQGLRMSKT